MDFDKLNIGSQGDKEETEDDEEKAQQQQQQPAAAAVGRCRLTPG